MEYQDKETFLELNPHNSDRFAETDTLLRSGVHIQEHKSQAKYFRFIEDNVEELQKFYRSLYNVNLTSHPGVYGKFYFIDYFEEQRGKLRRKSLDSNSTLFAIFLYTFHKTEKRFSTRISRSEVLTALSANSKIKNHIQRLFFGAESQDTITTIKTIEKWVKQGFSDLEKLGWLYLSEDTNEEIIEVLPAFERIALIYHELINNIESIDSLIK
jgi:chromosome condensin MukBEF MukE localization factor